MNQDGTSNGIMAPNGVAQEELIVDVYERFGIDPADIRYVEAHGTGTLFGDAVEANALVRAFRRFTERSAYCALGTVKATIGHTAAAAGVIDVVLRPGCYLTHDVGIYRKAQTDIFARNPIARKMGEGLLPALQLWAYVQSIPEPERAIVALGKRDAAFDAGLPEPARHFRPGAGGLPREIAPGEGWEVTGMMDQHAYLKIPAGADLKVGDMVSFDISHPCLTFDKWRQLLVVDPQYRVTEVIETYF